LVINWASRHSWWTANPREPCRAARVVQLPTVMAHCWYYLTVAMAPSLSGRVFIYGFSTRRRSYARNPDQLPAYGKAVADELRDRDRQV
jgi:hypothetical protein